MSDRPERRLADAIRRRGLALPARVLLDAHRPMAPLAADASAALGPLIRAALPPSASAELMRLVADRDDDPLTRLLSALDEHDERDAVTG